MLGRERETESIRDFKLPTMVRNGRVISLPVLLPGSGKQSGDQSASRGSQRHESPQERGARRVTWRDEIASIAAKRFRHEGQKMKLSNILELMGDALFFVAVFLTFRPFIPLLLTWIKQ